MGWADPDISVDFNWAADLFDNCRNGKLVGREERLFAPLVD
jgi:hypothetical protein